MTKARDKRGNAATDGPFEKVQIQVRSTVDNNGGKFDMFAARIAFLLVFYCVTVAFAPPDSGSMRTLVRYSTRNGRERGKFECLGGGTEIFAEHSHFPTFSIFLPYPLLCHCAKVRDRLLLLIRPSSGFSGLSLSLGREQLEAIIKCSKNLISRKVSY